jgi:hemerythrin HHE cation binding domain-containing protein
LIQVKAKRPLPHHSRFVLEIDRDDGGEAVRDATEGQAGREQPVATLIPEFIRGKVDQLALCDTLEHIADSLPDRIDRPKCLQAAAELGPTIRSIHTFEEELLFPALAAVMANDAVSTKTLERLRFEHCEDECFAEELTEALLDLGRGAKTVNIEATGYMLRGFFEAVRRHVATEREIVQRYAH